MLGPVTPGQIRRFFRGPRVPPGLRRNTTGRKRKRPNAGTIALREVKKLKKAREVKTVFTVSVLGVPAAGTAAMASIFTPVQGTTDATRIGDLLTINSISGRIQVAANIGEGEGHLIRVMFVYDRRPLGAAPAIADILENASVVGLYQSSDRKFAGRFQIFYDKTFIIGGAGSVGVSEVQFDKFFIKRTLKMEFEGNAGDVTDIEKGNLLGIALSDARNTLTTIVTTRYAIKFTDS